MTQFDLDIEDILRAQFPRLMWIRAFESITRSIAAMNPGSDSPVDSQNALAKELAESKALQAKCRELPAERVAELATAARVILRKREAEEADKQRFVRQAAEAKAEIERFYNQPSASADFGFWCKVAHWTAEEAAALLLARDPRRVNPTTLMQELSKSPGLFSGPRPARSKFHDDFDGLALLFSRASEAQASKLTPAFVVAWADRSGMSVPSALVDSLEALKALPFASQPAEVGTPVKWTDERLDELRAYRATHTVKATAKQFHISEQRVRQLLPKKPKEPRDVQAHNVFAQLASGSKRSPRG